MSMESAHIPLYSDRERKARAEYVHEILNQSFSLPNEVAKWLDVSVDWVHNHATRQNPHLPVVRIGKLVDRAHDFAEALAIESRRSPLLARPIRNVNYRR
jgi:hypothetical protein